MEPTPAIAWPAGPADVSLTPGEVHVWAVSLDSPDSERQLCFANLSGDERQRASRFLHEVHRHRFIAAHGALRAILARYLDRPACSLKFRFGPNGKPELAADFDHTLYFNLAHSENLALIAVGTNSSIGVDVERVRWLNDFDELVARFFSPRETDAFRRLDAASKPQAFFNLWTRKEAWLKATGEGIGYSLNRVEVSFLHGEPAKLLALPPGLNGQPAQWSLIELAPATDFTGSLAINATDVELKCWAWDAASTLPAPTPRRPTLHAPTPPRSALPIAIAGVRFDNVTIPQAVDAIQTMIASREPHYLVTANVDFVVQAQTDIELRRIFFDAHLVLCDGTPLLWASELLGNALPERVAGADIVPLLIRSAAQRGYRLFFLGAAPDSLAHAMENLRRLYPKLLIAGSYSPPFRQLLEMDHDEIRRRVTQSNADLLFVSLGCPKQEKWVAMNYRSLNVPVTIGVGATIDFLAGHVRRAPVWMQRSGLEWLYRLAQEPRRLYRRYSRDMAVFVRKLIAQFIRFRIRQAETLESKLETLEKTERAVPSPPAGEQARRSVPGAPPPVTPESTRPTETPSSLEALPAFSHDSLKISGRLDAHAAKTLLPSFHHVLSAPHDCFLDLSGVMAIDSTGIAMLMGLQRDVRALGKRLVLLAPAPVVTDALKWMQLDSFFDIADEVPVAERMLEKRIDESLHTVILDAYRTPPALLWQGEITAANAEKVWQETHPHILVRSPLSSTSPSLSLTIDLSGVRFIDSSGLGLMIRARKTARQVGSKITFSNPQPAVLDVVRLARLEPFLFDTEPEEITTIRNGSALVSVHS